MSNIDGLTWCYSLGINTGVQTTYESRTAIIATVTFSAPDSNRGIVTCTNDGSMYPIDLDTPACADSRYGIAGETAVTCTPGVCEIPILK